MRRVHSIQFAVIGLLVGVTAAGEALIMVSTNVSEAEVELTTGRRVELPVFSPFGNTLRLEAEFQRNGRSARPELGTWRVRTGDSGVLDFPDPGALVVIQAVIPDGAAIALRASPASSFSADTIGRSFYPATPDVRTSAFSKSPNRDRSPLALPAGWVSVHVTVLEAAGALRGETVKLQALPPLSLKSCLPAYCWLGWFLLWPWIAAPLLTIWLVVVSWFAWRERPQAQRAGEK